MQQHTVSFCPLALTPSGSVSITHGHRWCVRKPCSWHAETVHARKQCAEHAETEPSFYNSTAQSREFSSHSRRTSGFWCAFTPSTGPNRPDVSTSIGVCTQSQKGTSSNAGNAHFGVSPFALSVCLRVSDNKMLTSNLASSWPCRYRAGSASLCRSSSQTHRQQRKCRPRPTCVRQRAFRLAEMYCGWRWSRVLQMQACWIESRGSEVKEWRRTRGSKGRWRLEGEVRSERRGASEARTVNGTPDGRGRRIKQQTGGGKRKREKTGAHSVSLLDAGSEGREG
eukprot:729261-Rhodomonas_salina.1